MRNTIRFILGDELVELTDVSPTKTVLDYLREDRLRLGTKEGCAEGDCGACTVAVGKLDGDTVSYKAVNACIQFLPTLDGCHVLTVEDLQKGNQMHPVQKHMVDLDASQCGFCTPGFVVSLAVLQEHNDDPDQGEIEDAIAGNLCRCTGYGPIVQAAKDAAATPVRLATPELRERLAAIAPVDSVNLTSGEGHYFAPATVDDFARVYGENPDATILAGGTDVGLWVTKMNRKLDTVIYTGQVQELLECRETEEGFVIGAAVRYSDLPETLGQAYPDFAEVLRRIGSRQVRNLGTVGGNIANGSPIGDTPPLLIAMDTRLVLNKGGTRREIALEDFFVDYGKQDRAAGEFVERIIIPKPQPGTEFRAYKISKRFDQDISALCAAFQLTVRDGVVQSARIAYGGMAATPKRATATEAALVGQPWSEETVEHACNALEDDYQPITDMRASADYRRVTAANLLRKAHLETTSASAGTRVLT